MRGDDLIACALRAHEVLGRESDLSPSNPRINAALSALVQRVLDEPPRHAPRVLADPRIAAVRGALVARLALAEAAMERHWAGAFCRRARLSVADLQAFTYWDCYRHLVEAEVRSLAPRLGLDAGESIAFVGAGPLPLSAVLLHLRTGLGITCVDRDAEACGLARDVVGRAGLAGIDVRCESGAHADYGAHPVVMVASLVPDKGEVMRRIQASRPSAVVALRSAEGLCTLLYDPVDETELDRLGCRCLGRTGHNPGAINTTLLYEAVPARRRAAPGAGAHEAQREAVPAAQ